LTPHALGLSKNDDFGPFTAEMVRLVHAGFANTDCVSAGHARPRPTWPRFRSAWIHCVF